ncbi:MAG: hypothetical protein A3G73_01435 [Rhodospirillales bacterium RIFCSPLOWO2_12_FULL_67_15]|nr:MAG: hypothetical protein A3G73_01435 [Rhodospirillales bacterium RIFCSPLOWO2_12_FULL_67_15]
MARGPYQGPGQGRQKKKAERAGESSCECTPIGPTRALNSAPLSGRAGSAFALPTAAAIK